MESAKNESPKDRPSTLSEPMVRHSAAPGPTQGERTHFSLDSAKSGHHVSHGSHRVLLIPMPPETDPPKKSIQDASDSILESRLMTTEFDPNVVKTLTAFARASDPVSMQEPPSTDSTTHDRSTSHLTLGTGQPLREADEAEAIPLDQAAPVSPTKGAASKRNKSARASPLSNHVVSLIHGSKAVGSVDHEATISEEPSAEETGIAENKQMASEPNSDMLLTGAEPEKKVKKESESAASPRHVVSGGEMGERAATTDSSGKGSTHKKKTKKSPSAKALDGKQDGEAPASDPDKKVRKTKKSKSDVPLSAKTRRSKVKSEPGASLTESGEAAPKRHDKKLVSKSGEEPTKKKSSEDKAPMKKKKKLSHHEKHDTEALFMQRGARLSPKTVSPDDDDEKDQHSDGFDCHAMIKKEEKEKEKEKEREKERKRMIQGSDVKDTPSPPPLIALSPLTERVEADGSSIEPGSVAASPKSSKAAAKGKAARPYARSPMAKTSSPRNGSLKETEPSNSFSSPHSEALGVFDFGGPAEPAVRGPPSPLPLSPTAIDKAATKKKSKKTRCCLLRLKDKLFKGKKKDKATQLPETDSAHAAEPSPLFVSTPLSTASKPESGSNVVTSPDAGGEESGFRLKRNKFILMPPELEDELPEDAIEHRSMQGKEEMLNNDDVRRKKNAARKLAKKPLLQQETEAVSPAVSPAQERAGPVSAGLAEQPAEDAEKEELRSSLVQLATKVKQLEDENTIILQEKATVQVVNKKLLESLDAETGGRLRKSRSLEKLTEIDPKEAQRSSFSGAIVGLSDHLERQSAYELEMESMRKRLQGLEQENAQLSQSKSAEAAVWKARHAESQEELHAIYEFLLAANILSIDMLKDYPERKDRLVAIQKCVKAFGETGHYLFQFTEPEEEEARWISIWADAYENICPSDAWMEKVLLAEQRVKEADEDAAFGDMQLLRKIPETLKDSLVDEMAELKKREYLIELHLCHFLKHDSVLTEEQVELIKEIEQVKQTNALYWNELKSLSNM